VEAHFAAFDILDNTDALPDAVSMRSPRFLGFLLIAAALLFGQQAAAWHAIGHLALKAPAQSEQEKKLPHAWVCDKCIVYAGTASAAPSKAHFFGASSSGLSSIPPCCISYTPVAQHNFFSRAPPRLILI
jgi:hypothetical protein